MRVKRDYGGLGKKEGVDIGKWHYGRGKKGEWKIRKVK